MPDPYQELGLQLQDASDPYQKLGLVLQLHPADGPDQAPENVGAGVADAAHAILSTVADRVTQAPSPPSDGTSDGPKPTTGDVVNPLGPVHQLPDILKPPAPPKVVNPMDQLLKPPPSIEELFGLPQPLQKKETTTAKPKSNIPHLTEDDFKKMWPGGPTDIIKAIVAQQDDIFPKYGITTKTRLIHFLAQISYESNAGKEAPGEDLNYSPHLLLTTDGMKKHFTPETAEKYGRTANHPADQKNIALIAYGPRTDLGNRPNTTDGWDFRGRGLLQTTGREDYIKLGKKIGLNLVDHPELVGDPKHALEIAAADFAKSRAEGDDGKWIPALQAADKGDVTMVTRAVNGGYNGLAERKSWTKRWSALLKNR